MSWQSKQLAHRLVCSRANVRTIFLIRSLHTGFEALPWPGDPGGGGCGGGGREETKPSSRAAVRQVRPCGAGNGENALRRDRALLHDVHQNPSTCARVLLTECFSPFGVLWQWPTAVVQQIEVEQIGASIAVCVHSAAFPGPPASHRLLLPVMTHI